MKDLLLKTNYLEKLNFMTLSITNNSLLAIVFYISLLYLVITLIMKKKYELLTILIVSTLGFVGIITIYSGNTHMHIMYMMILFFIYWQIESNKRINRLIVIIFLCTFLNTTEIVYADFRSYYSPAKITSEYINNNIDKNEKLYCLDTSYCASLIPYNKEYQFIDIRSNESFKYVDWTKNIYLEKDIKEYELSDNQISSIRYIIIPQNFDNKFENNYKTIYISPSSGFESFIILEKK